MQEGEDDGLGVTVGQVDGFMPPSEIIHIGKEETAPSWRGKGTAQMDVDVVETCIWNIEGASGRLVVATHFCGSARDSAPHPFANILLQAIKN